MPVGRACGLALALPVGAAAAQAQYSNTLSGLNYNKPYAAIAAFLHQQMQQNSDLQTQLRAVTSTAPSPPAGREINETAIAFFRAACM